MQEHERGVNEDNKNVSGAEVQKYLKGMEYPASKEDAIRQAETNDAPSEVVETIKGLRGEEFGGPQDVMKAFGKEKRDE